jgi:integrase
MCRGRWRQATKDKSEFEIKKYLVSRFQDSPLAKIGTFEIQMLLNDLAQEFSESIIKHAFVNIRSIMRMAKKLKFIADDPGDGTRMPETKAVSRPTMTAEQIIQLIDSISDPHDLCLISIGVFCATRTSETFGLQWKCYVGDKLIIHSTAYEGSLFPGKVKTNASGSAVPVPEDIRPIIDAWKQMCQDTSPDSLMFATTGRNGSQVPRRPKNFLKWRVYPIAHRLGIPRRLVTFQVMRRIVGTDLQKHGTIKDAQQILRHANIQTTGNVYMQEIPASVVAAINSRTRKILANRKRNLVKLQDPTGSNGLQLAKRNKVSA